MDNIALDPDGLALLRRHADWWQRKGSLFTTVQGAPLGDLWLPLADGTLAAEDMDLRPEMLDIDRLAGPPQQPGPLQVHGDLFRTVDPYARIPWVEAILGTPIHATIHGGSMRGRAFIGSWQEWEQQTSHRDAAWLDLLRRLTMLLAQRSNGRYAVVQPLMRGPSDLAEAVLGHQLMSFSLYDHPQSLQHFLVEMTDTFIAILREVLARIPRIQGGYVSPFGIWAPGTVVRTQCDASAFLSPAHYAQWFLPHDVRICESVDCSIIHLHSCSLHTVDALLAVERPHAIQVTLETGHQVPSLAEMLPTFHQILQAKPLLLEGPLTEDEVRWLKDQLPSGGLAITARQAEW
jgi:hypothetical protein